MPIPWTSHSPFGWRCCEDFWDISSPICDIHWWGMATNYIGNKYYPSDPFLFWIFHAFNTGTNSIKPFYQKYSQSPFDSQLAEIFISSELHKQKQEFYYYRKQRELDFYLPKKRLGIEVKYKNKILSQDLEALRPTPQKILISKETLDQRNEILIIPAHSAGLIDWKNFNL